MKSIVSFLVFFTCMQSSFSQSFTAIGTVKNEAGNPIPAALVSEFKSKTASATYTDSLGFFSMPVGPFSKLTVSCKGYNDTIVNTADKKNISVILSKAKAVRHSTEASNTDENPLINKNLLQDAISTQTGVTNSYVYGGGVRNYTGSLLPVFTHKEETKGSRYLFDEWMHGYARDINGEEIKNSHYLFNYDKMEGGLLLTQDKQSAIEVDRKQIQSFTVFVNEQTPVVYENVAAIDNSHFVQLISAGSKYKIYKQTKTKFEKSNYHTDGMTTTGNPYDEYIDENTYFVLNVQSKQMQKFLLKKKSIKDAFNAEGEKLNKFFSENSSETINDNYLKNMGDYLNN